MSNIMQDLHTIGINPFAVTLLAESVLKSPLAQMTVGKPQGFFFPINRSDCAGWAGVRITVEAVRSNDGEPGHCARHEPCECAPEAREGCVSWRPNVGANRAAEGGPVERPVRPLVEKREDDDA